MERTWIGGALGAFAALLVATWSLGTGSDVPLLVFADLGFHELGHLVGYITRPPEWMIAIAGTAFQIAVPLAAALALGLWRRDPFGATICLAWCATSLRNSAVYVADAPYERLPLIGGEHDWAYLLGDHWRALHLADDVAAWMVGAGWALVLVGAAVTALAVESRLPDRRGAGRRETDAAGVL